MGIVLSGGPIILDTIDPIASLSNSIDRFADIVNSAGWSDQTNISGGFKWTLTSPQGLTCKCNARVASGSQIELFFTSFDEVRIGFKHIINLFDLITANKIIQIWCNPCQIFWSVEGEASPAFQGGIPYVDNILHTTEAWWTNRGFRTSYFSSALLEWSACYNGNLLNSAAPSHDLCSLRLSSLTLATGPDNRLSTTQRTRFYGSSGIDYYSDGVLYVEPFLIWGAYPNITDPAIKRGRLYDAILPTLDRPFEYVHIINDPPLGQLIFINYAHHPTGDDTRMGCIYLLTEIKAAYSRGAYVY